jgi:hypothetical protein
LGGIGAYINTVEWHLRIAFPAQASRLLGLC